MAARALLLLAALGATAQEPLTVPERSQWQATSTTREIRDVMAALALRHPALQPYTPPGAPTEAEGGAPLLAWRLRGTGPAPLRVYLNANIHAGEVEGKEAVQILVRELLEGRHPELRKHLDLVVMPAYNADGTDALDPANRRHQPNPASGVGRRENHLGLDLNRDLMKAAGRSTQFFHAMMRDFDPALVLDLHTTNGSCHGFKLTYAPAQTPGADPDLQALNRRLLKEVRDVLQAEGMPTFDYGDFEGGEPARGGTPKAWKHFDPRPRYLNNYPALHNRLGILSEAFVYLPFQERVTVTRRFALACLQWAASHADEIRRTEDTAAKAWMDTWKTGRPTLPLRAEPAVTETAPFKAFVPVRNADGSIREITSWHDFTLPAYVTFRPLDPVPVPDGYLVDPAFADTVGPLLRSHGIQVLPGTQRPKGPIQYFRESGRTLETDAYQGVFPLTLQGQWMAEAPGRPRILAWHTADLDRALYVPMAQPHGRLAFYLLDPRSNDGLVHWGLFHSVLVRGRGMWGEPPRFPVLALGAFTDREVAPAALGPARKAE